MPGKTKCRSNIIGHKYGGCHNPTNHKSEFQQETDEPKKLPAVSPFAIKGVKCNQIIFRTFYVFHEAFCSQKNCLEWITNFSINWWRCEPLCSTNKGAGFKYQSYNEVMRGYIPSSSLLASFHGSWSLFHVWSEKLPVVALWGNCTYLTRSTSTIKLNSSKEANSSVIA